MYPDKVCDHHGRWWLWCLAGGLLLVAFTLRPLFSSLSVLLPDIIAGTGLSPSGAGYLTTLPVLCLGLFAPLTTVLVRHAGLRRTLLLAVIVVAAGTALRGHGGLPALFAGTLLAGIGIAVGNVVLPAIIKHDFPSRIALMTGLYTMAFGVGTACAAAFTVPLVQAFDGTWRFGLLVWALPTLAAAVIWFVVACRDKGRTASVRQSAGWLWRDRLAWRVTLFMGFESALAYCVFGWLAPILQARGLDDAVAGWVTSVSILFQAAGSLLIPLLTLRLRDQRWLNVILSVLAGAGLLGLLWAPLSQVWFWAVLQGITEGGLFGLALTIIGLRSPNALVAAGLSGMAQSVGYVLAASGPLLIGLLRDWTGGYAVTAWLFVALIVATGWAGWGAGRRAFVGEATDPT